MCPAVCLLCPVSWANIPLAPELCASSVVFAGKVFSRSRGSCGASTHLLLAILAQRFTLRLNPSYEPRWEMRGVLCLANGLPMVIAAR
jgi:hypothetical protein